MKRWMTLSVLCALLLALAGSAHAQGPDSEGVVPQAALGTAFTYQGHLEDGGSPANGSYDFRFRLYDAQSGGSTVGAAVTVNETSVAEGLFAVRLDFGANAFTGQARYLEVAVRPGSSTGDYAALSPRQPLTAAPYALYAATAPWSGLRGVPAGFADGADADALGALSCSNSQVAKWNGTRWACSSDAGGTSYSAGPGLILSGTQFRVNLSGSGSANTVARSDHNHLGQTWTGTAPLKIEGNFGSPDYAPLVLSNNHASGSGLRITSAGEDGLYVRSAGSSGVYVYQADIGVFVSEAVYGLLVGSAHDDGVYVYRAGSPSRFSDSSASNGFEVAGAEGNGLYVGQADMDGVHVNSATRYGVYVGPGSTLAGYFLGNVNVVGSVTKAGGSFKIDHPLDPENKTLSHSFVESPDMMNVYNGNVTLDADGAAWVELPEWFEALNHDYRYQLTPIGGPGPNLYIAQEVQDNRFQIAGGAPGLKVSWQVTGIRHDPWAEANRIVVEEDKPPEERGTYLHPQEHGQPESCGLTYKLEAQEMGEEGP